MVVAPYTDAHGAEALGERLRLAVYQNPTVYQNKTIPLSVSVGVAIAEAGTVVGYEALRELAAAALAQAKLAGRNRSIVREAHTTAMRFPFASV